MIRNVMKMLRYQGHLAFHAASKISIKGYRRTMWNPDPLSPPSRFASKVVSTVLPSGPFALRETLPDIQPTCTPVWSTVTQKKYILIDIDRYIYIYQSGNAKGAAPKAQDSPT